jgi:hypothetical protein
MGRCQQLRRLDQHPATEPKSSPTVATQTTQRLASRSLPLLFWLILHRLHFFRSLLPLLLSPCPSGLLRRPCSNVSLRSARIPRRVGRLPLKPVVNAGLVRICKNAPTSTSSCLLMSHCRVPLPHLPLPVPLCPRPPPKRRSTHPIAPPRAVAIKWITLPSSWGTEGVSGSTRGDSGGGRGEEEDAEVVLGLPCADDAVGEEDEDRGPENGWSVGEEVGDAVDPVPKETSDCRPSTSSAYA